MKQFMIFWKRSDLKMWKCFVVISLNASVQNNGKRDCLIKVLYQELVWKCLLGPVHILESLGTVLNPVGFSFSIPQDGLIKPRSHCPGLRCRFTPVWWSGMNRDEPCHNRGGTVDNLGDPGWTVLNRVKPAHVPGCFKMFKTTGTHRE